MTALAILSLLLTLSTFTHGPAGVFFAFVIVNGISQAAAGSYLQTSVIAVASQFGPAAMQALFSGQAAVGVAVSLVQVLSAAASVRGSDSDPPSDGKAEAKSAFVFFGLSFLFLLASAGAYIWMTRLPSYKAVVISSDSPRKGVIHSADRVNPTETHGLVSSGPTRHSDVKANILRIAKANLVYETSVAYVFIVTLAEFPPLTVSIQPTNPATHPLMFSALHFLIFNIGDFIGRYLCSTPSLLIWSARRLAAMSFARTIFIPLFLMCNVQRDSPADSVSMLSSTPVINSDMVFFLLLLLFGLSNGYVCSMGMMSAASLEHNRRLRGRKEDVDVAATVASFCLVAGLVLGSAASFGVRSAVCGGCNPFKG
ncbi:delayed-early response protein/equilibrative nucleoside transporter [Gloeophyllum trabeum ATCC 11539]|uniref:Delayed-early response protein/equilibrative nucleoside transporter n=1 Tax=Gloeophyllum trabeum (strain ATCC 11539 / FP-39264 / Madison 617) TaxID=670483 RepID=S7QK44_GLOTA|nr:delayed-early response protein/equilibrative nucleoside transporter [Gloeophyllum trabeum ATCC 11539]EPQ59608.1 delayed-early response protein/equilibrative nucleoside transporter [Gloeophyllum trabeum ATCC 11539]